VVVTYRCLTGVEAGLRNATKRRVEDDSESWFTRLPQSRFLSEHRLTGVEAGLRNATKRRVEDDSESWFTRLPQSRFLSVVA
jgi:hypothetical protein